VPPSTTLWPLERHTEAKHRVLKRYLQAWLPIVVDVRGDEMWLVDGFAGPGEYSGGQPGSPIHMLDAYLEHKARDRIDAKKRLRFVFIEQDPRRKAHLDGQVATRRSRLGNSTVEVLEGDFGELMPDVSKRIESATTAVPAFLFVDPFGYEQTDPVLTTRLLARPHCETLTFVPIEHIARFVTDERMAATLDNLFRGGRWRPTRSIATLDGRIESLRRSYIEMLREDATYVRSFRIRSDSDFALFFASNHPLGLRKMKEAMWTVDPVGGTTFSDSTAPGQEVFFADAGVSGAIEAIIQSEPGWRRLSVLEAALDDTPYLPKHLKEELARLEKLGRVHIIRSSESEGLTLIEPV
jgi:three-Cys-motif partner protein